MKKEKPEYWYNQSGVIPYKKEGGELKILLIRSRKGKRWIFPKGIIEPGLSPEDSAVKEAFEEAGVEGKLVKDYFVKYKYKKWGGICEVKLFLMKVEKIFPEWPEMFRERNWFYPDQISKVLKKKKMVKIINDLVKFRQQ